MLHCLRNLLSVLFMRKAIIEAGITRGVTCRPNYDDTKWAEEFRQAARLLEEARVEVIFFDGP